MARIVIVGASQASREQLSRLLASSGFTIFRLCASGGELRRALNTCEDGVVVITGAVPGCLPDDIAKDFGDSFLILWISRAEVLATCESPDIFKLTYPCTGSAVVAAVEMLSQLHTMRLPKRTEEDKQLVERAKQLLMQEYQITEPEAHRRMQQYAMRHNMKMIEYAAEIIADTGTIPSSP